MKLVTQFELAAKNTNELHLLYRDISNALVKSNPHTDERRICIASLYNINREIGMRKPSL